MQLGRQLEGQVARQQRPHVGGDRLLVHAHRHISGAPVSRRGSNGLPTPLETISIWAWEAYFGVSSDRTTKQATPTARAAISSFGITPLTAAHSALRSMSSGEARSCACMAVRSRKANHWRQMPPTKPMGGKDFVKSSRGGSEAKAFLTRHTYKRRQPFPSKACRSMLGRFQRIAGAVLAWRSAPPCGCSELLPFDLGLTAASCRALLRGRRVSPPGAVAGWGQTVVAVRIDGRRARSTAPTSSTPATACASSSTATPTCPGSTRSTSRAWCRCR